jgi:hypothetical protein
MLEGFLGCQIFQDFNVFDDLVEGVVTAPAAIEHGPESLLADHARLLLLGQQDHGLRLVAPEKLFDIVGV